MKLISIEVRGTRRRWSVNAHASTKEIEAMRADGIDVCEIVNVIPAWVVDARLTRPFIALQELWNFKNPFGS